MSVNETITETVDSVGQDVKNTGRSVWLAGLGAASSVQEQGRKLFDTLVERGQARKDKGFAVPQPLRTVSDEAGGRVKNLGRQVESRLEEGVTGTMKRFGVPVRRDFEDLIERIDTLTQKVDSLAKA